MTRFAAAILAAFTACAAFAPTTQTRRRTRAVRAVEVALEKPLGLVLEEVVQNEPRGLYVAEIRDTGSAAACADVRPDLRLERVGDVDCTTLGFDDVMDLIADAPSPVALAFAAPDCAVTVVGPEGEMTMTLRKGENLRAALLQRKAKVYDFKGTMMNCNGGGQCGLCAVVVRDGAFGPQYDWEAGKLKRLGPDARLACQTTVAGDAAVVELQPK
mmetsp:Transcript_19280/g.59351  ORF Transcript_19280/g.59351 Transcript_19280/m.59351 type:complete len:215 (-) Transcript_19280:25-669(-)